MPGAGRLARTVAAGMAGMRRLAITATVLRRAWDTAASDIALEQHYAKHPQARPSLAEIAQALAAQDGSPVADRPDLIASAAEAVVARHPDADADDVLLWAEAQLAITATNERS